MRISLSSFFDFSLKDGAIYQPSGPWEVGTMINLLEIREGDKAADLGSGDGRIVIAMAKKGAEAHGFEKNTPLVNLSLNNIEKEGLVGKAFIHNENFWEADLSPFNKISIFQVGTIMERLEKKLDEELVKDSLVVSHHWEFPNWQPINKIQDIYLYKKL